MYPRTKLLSDSVFFCSYTKLELFDMTVIN